jgi:hypothetical protein
MHRAVRPLLVLLAVTAQGCYESYLVEPNALHSIREAAPARRHAIAVPAIRERDGKSVCLRGSALAGVEDAQDVASTALRRVTIRKMPGVSIAGMLLLTAGSLQAGVVGLLSSRGALPGPEEIVVTVPLGINGGVEGIVGAALMSLGLRRDSVELPPEHSVFAEPDARGGGG